MTNVEIVEELEWLRGYAKLPTEADWRLTALITQLTNPGPRKHKINRDMDPRYVARPLMDADGRSALRQACFACKYWIELRNDPHGMNWIAIDQTLKRHRKCTPH